MNSVCIIGNLTRDPELRHLPSGTEVAEFGIAVNSKKGDEERADFFDVTTFGKQAEVCAQYLAKGRKVAIEGRLQQDRWQTEGGENRSKVKIVAHRVDFLTPRDENAGSPQYDPSTSTGGGDFQPGPSADDDIPF